MNRAGEVVTVVKIMDGGSQGNPGNQRHDGADDDAVRLDGKAKQTKKDACEGDVAAGKNIGEHERHVSAFEHKQNLLFEDSDQKGTQAVEGRAAEQIAEGAGSDAAA